MIGAKVSLDDTAVLLAIDVRDAAADTHDEALEVLSRTVVTAIALNAKAQAYEARITLSMRLALNAGASLDEVAEAAMLTTEAAATRLELLTISDAYPPPRTPWWHRLIRR